MEPAKTSTLQLRADALIMQLLEPREGRAVDKF